ncbi:MAG TPA: transposase, partial [Actinomycetota bacterium]|nr:transposase [Actinomycetota bacterium]
AGPTGYDTHRQLASLGVRCDVIAPALIPRRAGRRVKTDRLDARNLVRLHRAGELTPIRVPTLEEEAIRDLWVRGQHFDEPATEAAFRHYLPALDTRRSQLRAIDAEIEVAAKLPPLAGPVARLRCLRGIDILSAVTIAAEVCDFRQFPSAVSSMAFTGLVPSEHSSGARERRGSITKTGNAHLRRVLVEAAWSYRHRPAIGPELRRRTEGQPPEVLAYAWHAQCRLCSRFRSPRRRQGRQRRRRRRRPGAGRLHLGTHDEQDRRSVTDGERAGVHHGRILADSMRLRSASLVRGSFRRTRDVRFRSADTSMVDRRCHVLARSPTPSARPP